LAGQVFSASFDPDARKSKMPASDEAGIPEGWRLVVDSGR
jgi:hypothetical protein